MGGGFTCNANKAETTVGYSTLYGDQSGFLAGLADLWKYQVYELAHYLNEHVYKREVIPQGIIDIVILVPNFLVNKMLMLVRRPINIHITIIYSALLSKAGKKLLQKIFFFGIVKKL